MLPAVVDLNVIIREGAVFHRTTSGSLIIETRAEGQDLPWVDALRAAGLEVEEVRPIAPRAVDEAPPQSQQRGERTFRRADARHDPLCVRIDA